MGALLRALVRALPVLLLLAALVAVGTYVGLGFLTPRYTATAKILIENREPQLTRTAPAGEDERALLDQEGIASQVQLITSRDLARTVAGKADLDRLPEFDPALSGSLVDDLLIRLGLKSEPSAEPIEERVLERFAERLDVYQVSQTRVIVVGFSAADPVLSARVTNLIADEYLLLDRSARRSDNADAARWLESQIENLRERVKEAEARVETFRSGSDLFSSGGEKPATISQQQLTDLNAELARIRGQRAAAEAQAAVIRQGLASGAALNAPEVSSSPLIQRLREQLVGLQAQIAQLSATLLPRHPRMLELQAQIGDLTAQTRREAERILRGLEGETTLARVREEEINRGLAQAKASASRSNDAEVQLRALEREASAQRELLETYLRRFREAVSRQEGDYLPAAARIISRAAVPLRPSFPRRLPITAAVTVAMLLLAIAVILLRELSSGRPLRRTAVTEPVPAVPEAVPVDGRLRWPAAEGVRRIMPAEPSYAAVLPDRAEESLRAIAGRIRDKGFHRIVVTTAADDDAPAGDRPLGAVALARSLAGHGQHTILVELDEDGADGRTMTAEEPLPGFSDLYLGDMSFAQVIFRDRRSRAHVIPLGHHPLPADAAGSERLATLLEALDLTYDHVVIDADRRLAPALSAAADAIVVVGPAGASDPRTARAVERATASGDATVLLLVVDPRAPAPEAEAA